MTIDFAILAPVPIEHLEAGRSVLKSKDYVSYGSDNFELFREVDRLRGGFPVPVLIYPSHEEGKAKTTPQITWVAEYIGHVQETEAKLSDERNGHRPATTKIYKDRGDSAAGWGVFWRVRNLVDLPLNKHVMIDTVESYHKDSKRKNSPPRGPGIVKRPVKF